MEVDPVLEPVLNMPFSEITLDVEKAIESGGGMHAGRSLNGEAVTLCMELSGKQLSTPYALTIRFDLVTCQTCLEWLHA